MDLQRDPGQLFPSAVINESLSRELGAQTGDAILLSPACASFGQFRDYRARGEAFVQLVGADA